MRNFQSPVVLTGSGDPFYLSARKYLLFGYYPPSGSVITNRGLQKPGGGREHFMVIPRYFIARVSNYAVEESVRPV